MSESGRDHYGLRKSFGGRRVILRKPDETERAYDERKLRHEEPIQLRESLKEVTPLLTDALDRNHFALKCLDKITCHITQVRQSDQETTKPPLLSFPEVEGDELVHLRLEVNEVERRLLHVQEQNDTLFKTLRRLIRFIVSDPPGISDLTANPGGNKQPVSCGDTVEKDLPQILYRLHIASKETLYDEELGILCPGWRKNSSADSPINKEQVVQHLRGDISSPPFISVSDSPARVINQSKGVDLSRSRTRVLVISFSKLQKLGSWCRRSTDVVEDLGIAKYSRNCPDGVHYATDSHWLIHCWIPQECVETEMDFEDFRLFCEGMGIVSRKLNAPGYCI